MAVLDIDPRVQPIRFTIVLHANNSLTLDGPLDDKELCLALLNNALDVVRNMRRPAVMLPNQQQILIPGKDVDVK